MSAAGPAIRGTTICCRYAVRPPPGRSAAATAGLSLTGSPCKHMTIRIRAYDRK
jgi:hypothetical protein